MDAHHNRVGTVLAAVLAMSACNGPPTGGAIRIEPADPFSSDDLQMILTDDFVDPNGDPLEVRAAWTRDGELVEDLDDPFVVPAAYTARGEVWAVQVSATDRKRLGPIHTGEVSVRNAPPSVVRITLSPADPTVNDVIEAEVSTSDADGDEVTTTLRWEVDGEEVRTAADALPAGTAVRGQRVEAIASVSDGSLSGTELRSEPVVIVNTPPEVRSAQIQPAVDLHADSTLECFPEGWSDADNDAPDYAWEWLVGDAVVGTAQTLEGGIEAGDTVSCRVTPTDGIDRGEPVTSAAVTIEPGSIYDCDPAEPMPAEPYRNLSIVPDRVQIEAALAYDRASGEFRSWCAGDGTRRVAVDVLVIGSAYADSGNVRDVCALSLVPTTETLVGERLDFSFDFRLGDGPSDYTHHGLVLRAGRFTVEDRRFRTAAGDTIGSCLARRFSAPWPGDIRSLFTSKDWTLGIGTPSDEVVDALRQATDGRADDPYTLYQSGYVFGVSSGSADTVGVGPLGWGQAYAIEPLTWTVATDGDGAPERLEASVAVPGSGARLSSGVYVLATSYVWFADALLEP